MSWRILTHHTLKTLLRVAQVFFLFVVPGALIILHFSGLPRALHPLLLDAAARAGVDPRTARRWREADPVFARRCDLSLALYIEKVEEEAEIRATTPQFRATWYRGRQVGHVRRVNDMMLVRLLRRLPLKSERNR